MFVKIVTGGMALAPGKLAEAELHFTEGPLAGLKMVGFAVWSQRQGTGKNVTFPSRVYSVGGERRSYALLRPVSETNAQQEVRDLILRAYDEHVKAQA